MAKALAVSYRPKSFDDVTEQDSVKTILQRQLSAGEVKNGYIFVGSAGCGKTTCARIFANAINHGEGNPIEMDAASNNSVDDVREIQQMAQTKSMTSEYKIFILDEVHMFSAGAWAAMLKLIEEPPAKSIFIMCTTDYWKIPKTILSRCQRFQFNRISTQGIVNRLRHICEQENVAEQPTSEDALDFIARRAEGGMRDAITTLDKCLAYSDKLTIKNVLAALGESSFDVFMSLTNAYLVGVDKDIVEVIERVFASGEDLKQFVKNYMGFCMDILKYKMTKEFSYTQLPDTEGMREWLKQWDQDAVEEIKHLVGVLMKLSDEIKWNTSPKNIIEARLIL